MWGGLKVILRRLGGAGRIHKTTILKMVEPACLLLFPAWPIRSLATQGRHGQMARVPIVSVASQMGGQTVFFSHGYLPRRWTECGIAA